MGRKWKFLLLCLIIIVAFDNILQLDRQWRLFAKEYEETTDYQLTLDEAVAIQFQAQAPPITSLYYDAWAYISREDVQQHGVPYYTKRYLILKSEPAVLSDEHRIVIGHFPIRQVNVVEGERYNGSSIWYEVLYEGETYYFHSSFMLFFHVLTKRVTDVLAESDDGAHIYGQLDERMKIPAINMEADFVKVPYQYWRIPKEADVRYYIDPDQGDELQHMRLDYFADVSVDELNRLLAGRGILDEMGAAFSKGAETYEINEAYLIAHALLETGHGTSALATGIEVGVNEAGELERVTEHNRTRLHEVETTYNMFGIGAADACPIDCGAKKAYELGWFSPDVAIVEGAEWIGKDYIYNEFQQNTLYKMKWNPQMADGYEWKQYATDIGWAHKQTKNIREIYDQFESPDVLYDRPLYKETD